MILAVATMGRAPVADFPRSSVRESFLRPPAGQLMDWSLVLAGSPASPPPGVRGREEASERAPLCIYPRRTAWDPGSEVFLFYFIFVSYLGHLLSLSLSLLTSHANLAKSLHLPEPHFPHLSNGGIEAPTSQGCCEDLTRWCM